MRAEKFMGLQLSWEGDPDIKRAHLMIDIFSQVNIWACSSVGRAYGSHP